VSDARILIRSFGVGGFGIHTKNDLTKQPLNDLIEYRKAL